MRNYPLIKNVKNVVKILDFKIVDAQTVEIYMEDVRGVRCDIRNSRKKFTPNEKLYVMSQMDTIITDIFDCGVLYPDIGDVNFLIDENNKLTLIDLDILVKNGDNPHYSNYFIKNIFEFFKWCKK